MTAARIPILLYHSVTDAPGDEIARWNVSPDTFLAHMDALASRGCTTLTVSQYLAVLRRAEPLPARVAMVTFDDGFAEVASFAAPALAERGIASTVYVTTGPVVEVPGEVVHLPEAAMVSAEALVGLGDLGVEIGAHSHTHPQLDVIGGVRAREELVRSKAVLEEIVGHRVTSFAYPHGYSDSGVRRLAREVGYESACGVRNAFSTLEDDPFSISRLTVENTTSQETIEAWLDGHGARVGGARDHYQTHLWRLYRRARFGASTARRRHGPSEVRQSA
jgi:peptidoglycan/xylan/chitin deacetylase (PgdA/CDA1 family)